MHRTHRALATLALSLALATASAAAAAATPPTATEDPHGQLAQPTALDQSERDTTLARHRALGALSEPDTTLARHRALGALAVPLARRNRPAGPGAGVDVVATLLVGLVGGLIGGALVVVGVLVTRPGRLRMRGAA